MFNVLKTAAFSAMIGLGALTAIPATAQAEDLYLNFGGGRHNDAGVGIYLGDGNRADYRRDRRYDRRERACSPDRALDKAERMGLRRARVTDVDRRTIEVSGRKRGDRVRITFARAPNCPIVGR